jgi:hypothetical protein
MIYLTVYFVARAIPLLLKLIGFILYIHFLILKGAFLTTVWLVGLPFRIAARRHRVNQVRAKRAAIISHDRRIASYESQLWAHLNQGK